LQFQVFRESRGELDGVRSLICCPHQLCPNHSTLGVPLQLEDKPGVRDVVALALVDPGELSATRPDAPTDEPIEMRCALTRLRASREAEEQDPDLGGKQHVAGLTLARFPVGADRHLEHREDHRLYANHSNDPAAAGPAREVRKPGQVGYHRIG